MRLLFFIVLYFSLDYIYSQNSQDSFPSIRLSGKFKVVSSCLIEGWSIVDVVNMNSCKRHYRLVFRDKFNTPSGSSKLLTDGFYELEYTYYFKGEYWIGHIPNEWVYSEKHHITIFQPRGHEPIITLLVLEHNLFPDLIIKKSCSTKIAVKRKLSKKRLEQLKPLRKYME